MNKTKPILMSTPMVIAILDGRKTQTRRVCKALENYDFSWGLDRKPYIGDYRTFAKVAPRKWDNVTLENVWLYDLQTAVDESKPYVLKPSYQPGDILWVRETWSKDENGEYVYRTNYGTTEDDSFPPSMFKWKPSIHMPREAARIFLRVTNVRVERVQDITAHDAIREGMESEIPFDTVDEFKELWNNLNAKRGYSWESNPWVWVIDFERLGEEPS